MLKSVEQQKGELAKIKDKLDAELIELNEQLKVLNEEKEAVKKVCHDLQKQLTNK